MVTCTVSVGLKVCTKKEKRKTLSKSISRAVGSRSLFADANMLRVYFQLDISRVSFAVYLMKLHLDCYATLY